MQNSNDTIGNLSRDLPVCSAVPQPLRHRVPLNLSWCERKAIPVTPCKAHKELRTLSLDTRCAISGQFHVPAALLPEKESHMPTD
jgi:hypothetical protein